jgi:ABC-type nitrate/sulfonate/bicarbonate transport system substrate-binding protein
MGLSDWKEQVKPLRFSRLISVTLAIAALLWVSLGFWSCSRQDDLEKVESITVGYPPFESATLFYIAEDQSFFSRNGLKMTPRKYDTGVATLGGLLNREVDLAVGIAEFPLVGRSLQKEKLIIIGSIDKAEFIFLLGRKDRAIEKVSDLRGKRVGTTFGTVAHFHLGRFLNLHGMSIKDLTLVDVKTPEEWVNGVVTGEIDAVATAQPYADFVKDRLGENGVVWPAQSGQPLHGLVISSNAWISRHPEGTKRFLKSLAEAEGYLISHPAEAKAILQKWLNLDAASVERIWSRNQFSLSLDQALVVTMEDEARWMISEKLTAEAHVPDFLSCIDEDSLKAVKPAAVNLIR